MTQALINTLALLGGRQVGTPPPLVKSEAQGIGRSRSLRSVSHRKAEWVSARPLTGHTPGATPLLHGDHKAEAVVGDKIGTVG